MVLQEMPEELEDISEKPEDTSLTKVPDDSLSIDGKIFDITRKLDIVQPEELFIETMHIMEEVLENETFAFYSISQKNGYGRLEVCLFSFLSS